jgi:hypothetical protein
MCSNCSVALELAVACAAKIKEQEERIVVLEKLIQDYKIYVEKLGDGNWLKIGCEN